MQHTDQVKQKGSLATILWKISYESRFSIDRIKVTIKIVSLAALTIATAKASDYFLSHNNLNKIT